jgi:hypothetical protein
MAERAFDPYDPWSGGMGSLVAPERYNPFEGTLPGSGEPPLRPQEARSYTPTWRERVAQTLLGEKPPSPARSQFVGGLTGSRGLPGTEQLGLVDIVPFAGAALAGEEEYKRSGDVTNAAASALTGGGATKLAILAGPMARTANHEMLKLANRLEKEGLSKSDVWDATGWERGADKKWRFEIPDQTSYWKKNPNELPGEAAITGQPAIMGEVFEHPELYKAYPELYGVDLNVASRPGFSGSYQGGFGDTPTVNLAPGTPARMRSVNLHELQHAVQDLEGFAIGGSNIGLRANTPAWDIYQERLKAIRTPTPEAELRKAGVLGENYTYDDYLREHKQTLKNDTLGLDRMAQQYAADTYYKRLAGEVEARNVQKRADRTPEELRDVPPQFTQDVDTDQQFVRFREPIGALVAPDRYFP